MDVIVITSAGRPPEELGLIRKMLDEGLTTLHIRKPKWRNKELEELIREIPEMHHKHIVIHGHYSLALKYNLKGIHLHRRHRSGTWKNKLRRLWLKFKRPNLKISTTFNSIESLRDNREFFDYVFLSSLFNGHAHYSSNEEAGINMLKSIIGKSKVPVYALGGVTAERIPTIKMAGFSGVGLSSAVWKHPKTEPTKIFALFEAA